MDDGDEVTETITSPHTSSSGRRGSGASAATTGSASGSGATHHSSSSSGVKVKMEHAASTTTTTTATTTTNTNTSSSSSSHGSASASGGGGAGKGEQFHCNGCKNDLTSNRSRMKCCVCIDFDLCVDCYTNGVEVLSHKKTHQCKQVDALHFALFSADWGADEELSLLDAIGIYGLGNWADVAEHVDTKTMEQCKAHYIETYLNVPTAPLPDPNRVICGKSKGALMAAAKSKEPRSKDAGTAPSGKKAKGPARTARQQSQHETETSSGYNALRNEFENEWENEAELVIKDISFTSEDTEEERELKFKALEAYDWKLRERHRRKQFIVTNGLLDYKKLQNTERRISSDKELNTQLRAYIQIFLPDVRDELLSGIVREMDLMNQIAELKTIRSRGITQLSEIEVYETEKKRHDLTEMSQARKQKSSLGSSVASGIGASPAGPHHTGRGGRHSSRFTEDTKKNFGTAAISRRHTGPSFPLLLSPEEQNLCHLTKLSPWDYAMIKETLLCEYSRMNSLPSKNAVASVLSKLDPTASEYIIRFFESQGWITTDENTGNSSTDLPNYP
ncbi:transcriptional adaptor 2 [Pelomyxa schiedti]|nr:transcriptional adaptor 2 [Pelomyxa schiedti]